jgi:predicted transcriptional regulator YdeE
MIPAIARNFFLTALAVAASLSSSAQTTSGTQNGATNLPVKTTLASPIYVAGFLVRTTNAKEMDGNGEIPKLWTRFIQQNLGAQIPNRVGQSLMVVYSDYASDEKGEYTYLLGAPVTSVDGLPSNLSFRRIPPGSYATLTTAQGPLIQVLQSAWKQIWTSTPVQLGGPRAFVADYEIYDQRSADPNNAQVEVHVGLQP